MIDENPFLEPLLNGDTEMLIQKTREALEGGSAPEMVLQGGLIPAMGHRP